MNIVFRIFLVANSLLLSLLVFLVKEESIISDWVSYFPLLPNIISYVLYFLSILGFTWVSLMLIRWLGSDNISAGSISTIEPANDSFLPSYLGYFFVALSVPNLEVFGTVFLIIGIFIFYSRISYFNPMFFLLGFNFYFMVNKRGIKMLLITKKQIKDPSVEGFNALKRINNYTFIDMGERK